MMQTQYKTQLLYPVLMILASVCAASAYNFSWLTESSFYIGFAYTLLTIGLYGSVSAINVGELRANRGIVIRAITIGVLVKPVIAGTIFYIFIQDKIAYLFGIAVAQIDPLPVAALLNRKDSPLSERAKAILGAWSSFDDPMTVLISLYVFAFIVPSENHPMAITISFIKHIGADFLFAGGVYFIYRLIKKCQWLQYVLLSAAIAVSAYFHLLLGIAIIAIFLRPYLSDMMPRIISAAFYISLMLIGLLLKKGVSVAQGLALSFAIIISQIIVGMWLTAKLDRKERISLALAQQNGLTAIILALVFESGCKGTVAVIAPAIFFINLGYFVLNALFERKERCLNGLLL